MFRTEKAFRDATNTRKTTEMNTNNTLHDSSQILAPSTAPSSSAPLCGMDNQLSQKIIMPKLFREFTPAKHGAKWTLGTKETISATGTTLLTPSQHKQTRVVPTQLEKQSGAMLEPGVMLSQSQKQPRVVLSKVQQLKKKPVDNVIPEVQQQKQSLRNVLLEVLKQPLQNVPPEVRKQPLRNVPPGVQQQKQSIQNVQPEGQQRVIPTEKMKEARHMALLQQRAQARNEARVLPPQLQQQNRAPNVPLMLQQGQGRGTLKSGLFNTNGKNRGSVPLKASSGHNSLYLPPKSATLEESKQGPTIESSGSLNDSPQIRSNGTNENSFVPSEVQRPNKVSLVQNTTLSQPVFSIANHSSEPVSSEIRDAPTCFYADSYASEPSNYETSVQEKGKSKTSKAKKRARKTKTKAATNHEWPENVEFDPKEEVETIGNRARVCGSIQPRDVQNQQGVKYVVQFNKVDQPLRKGGSILVRYLGYLAKLHRMCPIGEENWPKVRKMFAKDIISLVRSKFVLPNKEIINVRILQRIGKTWRNYRHTLMKKYFNPKERSIEAICAVVPTGVYPAQWRRLVIYWNSDKFKKLSDCGKEGRKALGENLHNTGSTSFADIRADFVDEHGRQPSYMEMYDLIYTSDETDATDGGDSDGGTINKCFKKFARYEVERQLVAAPSSKTQTQIEDEVFNDLIYDEHSKRPVGHGFRVSMSALRGVRVKLQSMGCYDDEGDFVEVKMMEGELEKVAKKNDVLEEKNKELEMKNEVLESRIREHDGVLMQMVTSMQTSRPLK